MSSTGNMRNTEDNLVDRFIDRCHRTPEKAAFILFEDEDKAECLITYAELQASVQRLAFRLKAHRLENNRAVLAYQGSAAFIISFLACSYAGVIPVPVAYSRSLKEPAGLLGIIEDAQAGAILCTSNSVSDLLECLNRAGECGEIKIIPTDTGVSSDEDYLAPAPACNEPAFIQYTSGSTGKPKGVVISGSNLIHNQELIRSTFGCDENSIIFSWLPFHHDMGLIGNILHTLYVGATCILMSPFHFMQRPKRWLEGISKYKVTHSGGPNFSYDLCVEKISEEEAARLDLSSWVVAYNGSEPIHSETMRKFSSHFKVSGFKEESFFPCYGLAEATLLVSGRRQEIFPFAIHIDKKQAGNGKILLREAGPLSKCVVSSGEAGIGIKVKILSESDGSECGELEEGEICIAGKSVSVGYWNKKSDSFFCESGGESFLRTGDLGFIYQGNLFVHGRIKEMLIIRGMNYYPYDIEKTVAGCDDAIESNGVVLFGIHESEERFVLAAEIKRSSLKNANAGNILSCINRSLNGIFGIDPYDILLTTPLGIPRTTSGKLQRVKCRSKYHENSFKVIASKRGHPAKAVQKGRIFYSPDEVIGDGHYPIIKSYLFSLIESRMGDLPEGLLRDDIKFTEIGIDSIRMMELTNILNRDLDINIDAARILQENTVLKLARLVESLLWLKKEKTSGKEITI